MAEEAAAAAEVGKAIATLGEVRPESRADVAHRAGQRRSRGGPVRPRSQTIGTLGRSPARASTPPPMPSPVPPPERGAIRRWVHGALFDNVGLKFLSLVLAVTVSLLVNADRDREITAHVGVSYTLPDDKVLVSGRIDEVRVTLKGPWQRLRKFDEREVERINLDVRRTASGEIAITNDMIHVPSGLTVTNISPRAVHIAFDKRVDKIVEVAPSVAGHPQHGYIVTEVKPVPATVKLRGAEGVLAALTAVQHARDQPRGPQR